MSHKIDVLKVKGSECNMKTQINTERIAALKPCAKRFENFKREYPNFEGDILEFLSLEKITPNDKIWVAVRVLPREILEIFAIDCAFSASEYAARSHYAANCAAAAAADYAAAANYAANYAAAAGADYAAAAAAFTAAAPNYATTAADYAAVAAANYAAAFIAERERQVDALIYLIESEDGNGKVS
jgi:hypothetical protein